MSSQVSTYEEINQWNWVPNTHLQENLIQNLEKGQVVYLPNLDYKITAEYDVFLDEKYLSRKTKNVSYHPVTNTLKGMDPTTSHHDTLKRLLKNYACQSKELIEALFPHYKEHLILGRTSFRPAEISGRKNSYRKDDTRLHVDAFPSTPTHGNRILRIFSNIHPHNKERMWHLGQHIDEVIERFAPQISPPLPGAHALLHWLHITKKPRSLYDHYMLRIHNRMKGDNAYQQKAIQERIGFPAHTSWIVYTDCVSHAAISGQHVLEQTFYLPVTKQYWPQESPLKKLESNLNRFLVR